MGERKETQTASLQHSASDLKNHVKNHTSLSDPENEGCLRGYFNHEPNSKLQTVLRDFSLERTLSAGHPPLRLETHLPTSLLFTSSGVVLYV